MRLGTRTSALAWTQSSGVAALIGADVELVGIKTSGDALVDTPLTGPLTKGWFTGEIEAALRAGTIDLAVHSLKDLPVADSPGLVVGATLKRGPVADLLLIRPDAYDRTASVLPLRTGARVGMSSPRRQAILSALRPDCAPAFLRGNVPTRIERLQSGRYDAIVLAEAGVWRLGPAAGIAPSTQIIRLNPDVWVPAPGQGALAVQCRADDTATVARLAALNDGETSRAVATERAMLTQLGQGCSVPFGALVRGESWVVGLGGGAGFRVRTGQGTGIGAAVAALKAGEAGEGPFSEVCDVGP